MAFAVIRPYDGVVSRIVCGVTVLVRIVEIYGDIGRKHPCGHIVGIDIVYAPIVPRSAGGDDVHDRFRRCRVPYRASRDNRGVRLIVAPSHRLVGDKYGDGRRFGPEPFRNDRAVVAAHGVVPVPVGIEVIREPYVGIGHVAVVSRKRIAVVADKIYPVRHGIGPLYYPRRAVHSERGKRSERIGGEIGTLVGQCHEQRIDAFLRDRFTEVVRQKRRYLGSLVDIHLFRALAHISVFVIGGIEHVIQVGAVDRHLAEYIDEIGGKGIGIGFQSVDGIGVQRLLAGDVDRDEFPGKDLYPYRDHLVMEHGVHICVFGRERVAARLYAGVAVVDVAFGINLVAVDIVEVPYERTDLVGGVLFGNGGGVYLGELEAHFIVLEIPRRKARGKLRRSHVRAQRVFVIGAVHQVQIGIDLYVIRDRSHYSAVFGIYIDVAVGIYLAVQYLDPDVFAVCRHHAVSYHDVHDEDTAVYRYVVPGHIVPGERGEDIVVPIDLAVSVIGKSGIRAFRRRPVNSDVGFGVPIQRVQHSVAEQTVQVIPLRARNVRARIDVIFRHVIHGAVYGAARDGAVLVRYLLDERPDVRIRRRIEVERLPVRFRREGIYRGGHELRFGYVVCGIGSLLVRDAHFDFVLTEVFVEKPLPQLRRLDDVIVAVRVIEYIQVVISRLGDDIPARFAHTEIVHQADACGILVFFVIIRDVGVQFVPYPRIAGIGAEPYDVQIVFEVVHHFVPLVAEHRIVSRRYVVHGVQIEVRGIVVCQVVRAVIRGDVIRHRFQRLPCIRIGYEGINLLPAHFRQYMDVVIPGNAHEQILHRGHIVHAVVGDGDGILVVQEVEVLCNDAVAEIEIHLDGVVEAYVVYAVSFHIGEVADGIHRERDLELVDVLDALSEAYLHRDGADEFVDSEEVLYRLVRGGDTDDVGFEGRPRVFHQRRNDVGKTQNDVVVLFRIEIVAHIRIETAYEMILAHLEARHPLYAVVLEPYISEFLDGVGGIQAYVVGVNVRERRDHVAHDHVQVQRECASRTPRPTSVLEVLLPNVLVIIQREIDIRRLRQDERRIQPRLVAHKRTEKLR